MRLTGVLCDDGSGRHDSDTTMTVLSGQNKNYVKLLNK
jgi:hypothetical protein